MTTLINGMVPNHIPKGGLRGWVSPKGGPGDGSPPGEAAQLAAPFGSTNLIPVPVVAAVSQGTLAAADATWLSTLQQDLHAVPTVVSVRDLGRSADGQAEQLQVLSNVGSP